MSIIQQRRLFNLKTYLPYFQNLQLTGSLFGPKMTTELTINNVNAWASQNSATQFLHDVIFDDNRTTKKYRDVLAAYDLMQTFEWGFGPLSKVVRSEAIRALQTAHMAPAYWLRIKF